MDPSYSRDSTDGTPHSGQHAGSASASADGGSHRGTKKGAAGRFPGVFRKRRAHLITDAAVGPGQDRHRREIIYSILQFLRVPSMLIAGVLIYYFDAWVIASLVVGITFPLPWIAVVIGNGRGQPKDKREKFTYKPAIARQMAQQQREALERKNNPALGLGDSHTPNFETIDHEDD